MPVRRSIILGLLAGLPVGLAVPVAAGANGGVQAPSAGGGAEYGQVVAVPRPGRLVVRRLAVTPSRLRAGSGARVEVSFRVDGGVPVARVSLALLRRGAPAPAAALSMRRRTGRTHKRTLTLPDRLAAGDYVVSLKVADRPEGDDRLRARAAASAARLRVAPAPKPRPRPAAPAPAPVRAAPPAPKPSPAPAPPAPAGGVFPVRGAWSFGYEGSRFGADRGGRLHRGQDVAAAEGTPLVAPKPGVVHWKAYQASGAGHYLVLRGDDGRDYVFMHLRIGSPLAVSQRVAAGAFLGEVGSSGGSSGPHLHFEIWPDGWYATPASQPIDPLPELRAWAGLPA